MLKWRFARILYSLLSSLNCSILWRKFTQLKHFSTLIRNSAFEDIFKETLNPEYHIGRHIQVKLNKINYLQDFSSLSYSNYLSRILTGWHYSRLIRSINKTK